METYRLPADWWKRTAVYQVYPKSFKDTSGNGVGDLRGVCSALDYLQDLGIGAIWIAPIFDSPMSDNGYDISDYKKIYPLYGTMDDLNDLLQKAHKRNIKIIVDIVVNHTSIEHAWFRESCQSKNNPYRNFYIWKDGIKGSPPTNWKSKFGGSSWTYDDQTAQYYLHIYDKCQADLNWENPKVRNSIFETLHYWLEKGVDGFIMDVINLISKDQSFPDDDYGDGRRFYTDGPRLHEFLREMYEEVFSHYDMITIGGISSTTIPLCISYSKPENKQLNITFNFHHLKVDYPNGQKWAKLELNFLELKTILTKRQVQMQEIGGWNTLFWTNHDHPRSISRFGNDKEYHVQSGNMLATAIHMMKGTPFIYQGEEIGMINPGFTHIEDYRDLETRIAYNMLLSRKMSEKEVMGIIQNKSRDNARTPMQWDRSENAGFTTGTPWIKVAPSYKNINVKMALADKTSIFYHYKNLLQLRVKYEVIILGDFRLILQDHESILAYVRTLKAEQILVVNNFYGRESHFKKPLDAGLSTSKGEILISNYPNSPHNFESITLRPYESIVYYIVNDK